METEGEIRQTAQIKQLNKLGEEGAVFYRFTLRMFTN